MWQVPLLFICTLLSFPAFPQPLQKVYHDTIITVNKDTVVMTSRVRGDKQSLCINVEQMPEAPYDVQQYLATNLIYPADAKETGISGRVAVTFIVRKDGTIDSPRILKSVHPSIDSEALRLIKAMPSWKPGKLHGQPSGIRYTLPVIFRLE